MHLDTALVILFAAEGALITFALWAIAGSLIDIVSINRYVAQHTIVVPGPDSSPGD